MICKDRPSHAAAEFRAELPARAVPGSLRSISRRRNQGRGILRGRRNLFGDSTDEARHAMPNTAGEQHIKERTMTKADLIEEVTRVTELPRKESELVVETIFDSIIEALQQSDKIEIRGFGSFRTRQRRG